MVGADHSTRYTIVRVHLSAHMVLCAQRNALMDRIPRSSYAKGRARGLLSIGWWLWEDERWGTSLLVLIDRAATLSTFHQELEVERGASIRGRTHWILAVRP